MPFTARNWRLKFDRLLKPLLKQMSVMLASPSISSWHARLIRIRFTYWTNGKPVCRRK
ncbi:Uncharacterised protein [Burkholderia pseudomallei]|nr:Uncharacterised protein [Burkholderia pseudomallei]CAJ3868563.1 Uncharacterised protein [Burkholderia pseudomallei]CAJ4103863.1 Uncharacterised protein [Burkholderia pseudomallei]CAJ4112344.1 Uncharacterised protein [Burkholderia pseudomallei]CAJ4446280.1 Uncharacterised protein [Burkholderia pseudomallei]